MTILRSDYKSGACRVNAAGTFVFNRGSITSVLRTGAGVYEIGVVGVHATECTFESQVLSATSELMNLNVTSSTDSLIVVRAIQLVGGAAALTDMDFNLEIHRVRTGS